jgi:tetratricopeptide (TPR) repeat protein
MKRVFILVVLLSAAAVAIGQTAAPAQKPQSGAAAPQTQPAPAAPAPGVKPPPQAKTQDEFKAFQEAAAKTTAADSEAAANAFAAKFPASELRVLLYRKVMYDYQGINNADKAIDMGRKMLGIDADNPEALVMVATFLSEKTRETDLDRDERLAEATKDAERALQTVDTDLMLPGSMPPEQVEAVKKQMKGMAYGALGTIAIAKKDFPAAETALKQATQLYSSDPLSWLRLAYSQDQEKKYPDALTSANNCIQTSADQPQVNNLCKTERDRLMKLTGAPAATPSPAAAPKPATPPPGA